MTDSTPNERGCPKCEWDGEVAITHDYTHEYFTHVIIQNGELFHGGKCTRRIRERRQGPLSRFFAWLTL